MPTDTHKVIEALRADEKFSKEQAESVVEAIRSLNVGTFATREDIKDVRHEMEDAETRLTVRIDKVETNLSSEIKLLATQKELKEVHAEIKDLKVEVFKWILPLFAGMYGLIFWLLFRLTL